MFDQLLKQCDHYSIIPDCLPDFTKGQSWEATLWRVTSDILQAKDQGNITTAMLLDYSKVLHLLRCSQSTVDMFGSYFSNRLQCVRLGDMYSVLIRACRGVPLVGPLLFSLCTNRLCTVVTLCQIQMQAGDPQVYLSFPAALIDGPRAKMVSDINQIAMFFGSS